MEGTSCTRLAITLSLLMKQRSRKKPKRALALALMAVAVAMPTLIEMGATSPSSLIYQTPSCSLCLLSVIVSLERKKASANPRSPSN